MKTLLSLAIVTKKRPLALTRCLTSLTRLSHKPHQIIIVDNDTEKSANIIFTIFKSRLPLRYAVEKKKGVAHARNKALSLNNSSYLAFVDDDCVMDPQWTNRALASIKGNLSCAYFLGNSELLNEKNIIAKAQYIRQNYWFHWKLDATRKTNPYIFDTKNVVLCMKNIHKYNVLFNPKFCLNGYDSSDTDFGFQLHATGLSGIYVPTMQVFHEESHQIGSMIRKAYYRGRLGLLLSKKWNLENQLTYTPNLHWFTWLTQMRFWYKEYKKIMKYTKAPSLTSNVSVFLLIKAYDRAYLEGYSHQAKLMNLKL